MKKNSVAVAVKMFFPLFVFFSIITFFSCSGSNSSDPPAGSAPQPPAPSTMQITQYGITWTFDKAYPYGQFANGDYWVVGAVKIIGINPPSAEILGITTLNGFTPGPGPNAKLRTMNGSMINPDPQNHNMWNWYDTVEMQGYDSEMYVWDPDLGGYFSPHYSDLLNVALNVSPSAPLVLPKNTSLISSISYPQGKRPQLSDAAVLTILGAAPPDGSFRPPYAGTDKTVRFNKSQIRYNLLPSFSLSGISVDLDWDVNPVALTAKLRRPWIDHFIHQGDGTQYSSPTHNMPSYGREYNTAIGQASMFLMSSETDLGSRFGLIKEDFAIGLIQIGIDVYGILKNGGCWPNNGGLNQGRKLPVILAGVLLNDDDMAHVTNFVFTPQDFLGGNESMTNPFAEDQTIFYVSQREVNASHAANWNPDYRDTQEIRYETSDIGLPEWCINGQTNPEFSNNFWDTAYRRCCTGNSYATIALSLLAMDEAAGTKALWGNPAFFDYVDRFMATEPEILDNENNWQRSMSQFNEDMWDKYRGQYGQCYTGFVSGTRQYGDCVAAGVVK